MFEKLPDILIDNFKKHKSRDIEDFKFVIDQQAKHIQIELDLYKQSPSKHNYKIWKMLDMFFRRIHEYCIKQVLGPSSTGSFYVDKNWKKGEKFIFEHNIPMAIIGKELLEGRLTLLHAMFPPITLLSAKNDEKIKLTKNNKDEKWLIKNTPNIQNFWERYEKADIHVDNNFTNVITKEDINSKWNLKDHYKMLKIS